MNRKSVTDLVRKAHGILRSLLPTYLDHGLDLASDEWQELCDAMIRALVVGTALDRSMAELPGMRHLYGLWTDPEAGQALLLVRASPGSQVMLRHEDGTWTRSEAGVLEGAVLFREFNNPLGDDDDPESFDTIMGVGVVRGVWRKVAIPLADAEFYLND